LASDVSDRGMGCGGVGFLAFAGPGGLLIFNAVVLQRSFEPLLTLTVILSTLVMRPLHSTRSSSSSYTDGFVLRRAWIMYFIIDILCIR
jgi:hypothetical protein